MLRQAFRRRQPPAVIYKSPGFGRPGWNMAETSREAERTHEMQRTSFFQRVRRHVQTRTIAGLMELVPLIVTIVVVALIVGYADNFVKQSRLVEGRPWDVPGIGLVVLAVIFYLAGLVTSSHFGRRTMGFKDTVLNSIPIVGSVYGVTQQAASAMSSQYRFSRVVFLEWPREGMIAVGFVTGRAVSEDTGESLVVVYIPTVPNPTSGNMAFVIEDDVLETDMTVEDAMKMVFSGGIVLPDSLAFARVPREPVPNEFLGRFEAISD